MLHIAGQISSKVNQLYTSRAERRAQEEALERKQLEEGAEERSALCSFRTILITISNYCLISIISIFLLIYLIFPLLLLLLLDHYAIIAIAGIPPISSTIIASMNDDND